MEKTINCHGHHCMGLEDTPEGFLGIVSEYLHGDPQKRSIKVQNFLKFYNHISVHGKGKKLASYLDTIDNTSEERLLEDLQYHDAVVCILTDLHYMGAGRVPRPFEEQIEEGITLKNKYKGRVYLFMMLDPNRPNLLELVDRYAADIDGWKLYPTWYFVTDSRLYPVFNKYNKPVIIHCTDTSPVYWQGSRSKLKKDLGEKYVWWRSKKWNCQFYSHPRYVEKMSKIYKYINWSCAHMGGITEDRMMYVLSMLGGNVYCDDSYTFHEKKSYENLVDILLDKQNVLHGTDYFMTNTDKQYREVVEEYSTSVPLQLQSQQRQSFRNFIGL